MLTGVLQLNATPGSYVYVNPEIEESTIMAAEYNPYTHPYKKYSLTNNYSDSFI